MIMVPLLKLVNKILYRERSCLTKFLERFQNEILKQLAFNAPKYAPKWFSQRSRNFHYKGINIQLMKYPTESN